MIDDRFARPSRRVLLAGAGALVVAGCSDIIGPPDAPQLFLLKPTGMGSMAGPKVAWQLSVVQPTASERLDSARIALVQSDTSVDFFANAAWTDRVSLLVQSALVEAFESSGRITGVAADSEGFHADYVLQMEVRDFSAHYAAPDGIPTVKIRIAAKLASSHERDIVANLDAAHEAPASENSVPAVVHAFDAALGAALTEIVNWTLAAPPPLAKAG